MKTILVTGGAGYIGSHVVKELLKNYQVIIFDNFSNGINRIEHKNVTYVQEDLSDISAIESCFQNNKIDAVIHLAGSIIVPESMHKPSLYFKNNVNNGVNLLDAMVKHKVSFIIYSSTAAVYGNPKEIPITENSDLSPNNFYGESKLMFEELLLWYEKIHGIKSISLRYFNASGAHEDLDIGENHEPETHLIPLLLEAASKNAPVKVYGSDYPTEDGTCIRDYVHVCDIAHAHVLALNQLPSLKQSTSYNLGSNVGYSVSQIVEIASEIIGKKIAVSIEPRRSGDTAILIASSDKIKKELGWIPKNDINSILKSAWDYHQKREPA